MHNQNSRKRKRNDTNLKKNKKRKITKQQKTPFMPPYSCQNSLLLVTYRRVEDVKFMNDDVVAISCEKGIVLWHIKTKAHKFFPISCKRCVNFSFSFDVSNPYFAIANVCYGHTETEKYYMLDVFEWKPTKSNNITVISKYSGKMDTIKLNRGSFEPRIIIYEKYIIYWHSFSDDVRIFNFETKKFVRRFEYKSLHYVTINKEINQMAILYYDDLVAKLDFINLKELFKPPQTKTLPKYTWRNLNPPSSLIDSWKVVFDRDIIILNCYGARNDKPICFNIFNYDKNNSNITEIKTIKIPCDYSNGEPYIVNPKNHIIVFVSDFVAPVKSKIITIVDLTNGKMRRIPARQCAGPIDCNKVGKIVTYNHNNEVKILAPIPDLTSTKKILMNLTLSISGALNNGKTFCTKASYNQLTSFFKKLYQQVELYCKNDFNIILQDILRPMGSFLLAFLDLKYVTNVGPWKDAWEQNVKNCIAELFNLLDQLSWHVLEYLNNPNFFYRELRPNCNKNERIYKFIQAMAVKHTCKNKEANLDCCRASLFYILNNYTKAIELYTKVLYTEHYNLAYLYRGRAYYFERQYKRALEDYMKIITDDPRIMLYTHHYKALVYYRLTKYDDCLKDIYSALTLNPSPELFTLIKRLESKCEYNKGNMVRSIQALYEAARGDTQAQQNILQRFDNGVSPYDHIPKLKKKIFQKDTSKW